MTRHNGKAQRLKSSKAQEIKSQDSGFCSTACEDFAVLLTEFFEGEGGEELRMELEEHTRVCPDCAEVLRSYVLAIRICRNAPRAHESKATHQKLWDELAREIAALRAYLK